MEPTIEHGNKKKTLAIALIAAIFVAGGIAGWLVLNMAATPPAPPANTEATDMSAPQPTVEAQVEITADGFVPAELSVVPGTRVVWLNATAASQRLTSLDNPKLADFGTQDTPAQESYVFTFDTACDYAYGSASNPAWQGVVHVKAAN